MTETNGDDGDVPANVDFQELFSSKIESSRAKGFVTIMRRRQFLEQCSYGLGALLAAPTGTTNARTAALTSDRD